MVHLFDNMFDKLFDEKNQVSSGIMFFCGWLINIFAFQYSHQLTIILGAWGTLIITFAGSVTSVITAMLLIISKDYYEHKLKHKWFKIKKDGNEKENKTDNERVA